MRRFVAGWMFCLVVMASGLAQTGSVGGAVPLEKTEWRLVRLGDAVVTANDLHQPHVALDPATHRVSGSGGCNRISGGYMLKGQKLTFTHVMSTMMACDGVMDTEQNLLKGLGEVKRWKIMGRQLTLMDGSGKAVAVFEAGDSGAKVS
jgi:heat shock protein HslJ